MGSLGITPGTLTPDEIKKQTAKINKLTAQNSKIEFTQLALKVV